MTKNDKEKDKMGPQDFQSISAKIPVFGFFGLPRYSGFGEE